MRFSRMFGPALVAVFASPLLAADLALVIVNSDYDSAPDLRTTRVERSVSSALKDAGFTLFRGSDLTGPEMQRLAGDFAAATQDSDDNRLVVVLSGHLAGGQAEGWMLGREVDQPGLFGVGAVGLPLGPLLTLAGSAPGHAVVMIARPDKLPLLGTGLTAGQAPVLLPEGVTLAEGPATDLATLLNDSILHPDRTYADAVDAAARGVKLSGYLADDAGLLTDSGAGGADTGEIAYWSAVRDLNTVDAYQAYIDRYPGGKFLAEARDAIADLKLEPERRAQADEAALNLSRDQRRVIQANLTAIGYSTRGVDGLFGPATRRAISAWQEGNGHIVTGYLNRAQVAAIQAAADRKAAQLAQEERDRQAAVERADRAYWRDLGQGQDEASLRAYLNRYPRGVFADTARERLKAIDDRRADEARREERRDWEAARRNDTEDGYRDFLRRYPRSAFADAARAALRAIDDRRQDEAGRAERRAWDMARGQDTEAAYRNFLNRYPRGRFADEARAALKAIDDRRQEEEAARAERRAWDTARGQDTEAAYRNFLNRYPRGRFANEARAALKAIEDNRQEEAGREERRAWDTARGQDTEAAYRNFLNRYPRGRFADEARAALKAIEDNRQEEAGREERRAWDTARGQDTEAAYRDFLNRYPRGRYANEARAALKAIEDNRQEEAGREERRVWEAARGQDSVAAYRDYLDRYPRGRFADEARGRIDALEGNTRDSKEVALAKREEAGLAGNQVTRLLIEQRLSGFGFNPGPVDGVFDAQTRNAILQFQTNNGLPMTGYVSNDTMALLIVGGR